MNESNLGEWFFKPYKNKENENYRLFLELGLNDIIPEVHFEDDCLRLKRCESVYPYFRLDNSFMCMLYESTFSKLYRIKSNTYSQGFYKYITLVPDVIRQPAIDPLSEPYFQYIGRLLGQIEASMDFGSEDTGNLAALGRYLHNKLLQYASWSPPMGFHLLHGDMKISNIVYDKKPKLIDLEFLRYGPAEIELSNFCVQLLGMHEASDEPVLHFLRQIWSCADCFGDIDYDIVFKLGIPLFMFFRMKYAAAGRIGSADKILKSYPVLWEKYKVIVL